MKIIVRIVLVLAVATSVGCKTSPRRGTDVPKAEALPVHTTDIIDAKTGGMVARHRGLVTTLSQEIRADFQ
jgi:hypothetical protein